MRMKSKKNKKAIVSEYLPWIIIAVLVLVIVLFAIMDHRDDGMRFIDQIKNLFRRT
jgi:sensor domain CHASE-containing protein